MARLDSTVGTHEYDNIFAGTEPAALTTTVKIAANKELKRGTVVCGAVGTALDAVSKALTTEAVYVLADDVKTGGSPENAEAYKTGCFARNKLAVASSYKLVAADIEYLRKSGIQTEDVL